MKGKLSGFFLLIFLKLWPIFNNYYFSWDIKNENYHLLARVCHAHWYISKRHRGQRRWCRRRRTLYVVRVITDNWVWDHNSQKSLLCIIINAVTCYRVNGYSNYTRRYLKIIVVLYIPRALSYGCCSHRARVVPQTY